MLGNSGKRWVRFCLLAAMFTIAATVTILAIQRWRKTETRESSRTQGSLDDIPGLAEGELVKLPKLPSLQNDFVDLSTVRTTYLLCTFISSECSGCSQDRQFWKDLRKELTEQKVAFYVIALDVNQPTVESFIKAYELKDLPVLFDPQHQALNAFKIGLVPQYVLLTPDGKTIRRWNGVRGYDPKRHKATDKLEGLRERLSGPLAVK